MTTRYSRLALFVVLLNCTLGEFRPAAAAVAVDITVGGNPLVAPSPEAVFGWEFSISQPIRLTHMGVYDDGGDGLQRQWKIDLWRLDQSSSTIAVEVGTGDPSESLVEGFRYHESVVSINPIVNGPVLDPGRYVISAGGLTFEGVDLMPSAVAALTTDPSITFLQARSGVNSLHDEDLVFPDVIEPGLNYFGPNFQFEAVPEPPTVILAGCGLLVILARARRTFFQLWTPAGTERRFQSQPPAGLLAPFCPADRDAPLETAADSGPLARTARTIIAQGHQPDQSQRAQSRRPI